MTLKTNFAVKPTLTGELVLLRPADAADAAGMLAADHETVRLTGTHHFGEFTFERRENWYATRAEHDDRLDLSIIERATGEWAGEVVLNELDVPNESCGFRIALQGPRFYGRGLGSEATRLVVGYAFNVVGVQLFPAGAPAPTGAVSPPSASAFRPPAFPPAPAVPMATHLTRPAFSPDEPGRSQPAQRTVEPVGTGSLDR